jgi:two-component system NarL family response regulator
MRVLLADDHALLLEGLQNLLEAHDIEVVGTARDGGEAAAQARRLRPEVILMDIRMPVCDGLCATRIIKSELPEIKIVILTTSSEDLDLFEAIKSGASGYLLKSMDAESLIEALHDAQRDIPPFAPGLAAKLLTEFARTAAASSAETPPGAPSNRDVGTEAAMPAVPLEEDAITLRQAEVLSLVARGLSYREVGARLHLSPRTVKYHMAEIMRKLHLQNRAQVLAYAGAVMPELTEPTEDTP